jgi:hypothetical protein
VTLRITLFNDGPLKSTDTFLRLKPALGHLNYAYDSDTVASVFGTKKGWYQCSLKRPLPPQSDVSFRAAYYFQATAVAHPSFGTLWQDKVGTLIDDFEIEWTVFADSAPPRRGALRLSGLGMLKKLREKFG